MTMPGFTGESSLYRSVAVHRIVTRTRGGSGVAKVYPQSLGDLAHRSAARGTLCLETCTLCALGVVTDCVTCWLCGVTAEH